MRRRLFLVLTLSTWLLATGCPWDLMQTVAWGRMFVSYSRSMPLVQAVKKTFSGDAMCGVCELVQDARHRTESDGAKVPGPKTPEKIFFVAPQRALVFAAAADRCTGLVPRVTALASADRARPPLPPPRRA